MTVSQWDESSLRRLQQEQPQAHFLDAGDVTGCQAWLQRQAWLPPGASLTHLESAGQGNVNCVLRASFSDGKRWVLKQGRPWVERYPQIAAPWGRTEIEALFYQAVGASGKLSEPSQDSVRLPRVHGYDAESQILALELLGPADGVEGPLDGTVFYSPAAATRLHPPQTAAPDVWVRVATWLAQLHALAVPPQMAVPLRNMPMRRLNHAHIFELPLVHDNGVDLDAITPGLGQVAGQVRQDAAIHQALQVLGQRYLADGPCLLHGDCHPGSWLLWQNPEGANATYAADAAHATDAPQLQIGVIDPEFAHMGDPAFDLGVILAQGIFVGLDATVLEACLAAYERHGEEERGNAKDNEPLQRRAWRYAGAELLRRLLGVAQLPLCRGTTLQQKTAWLSLGRDLLLHDSRTTGELARGAA